MRDERRDDSTATTFLFHLATVRDRMYIESYEESPKDIREPFICDFGVIVREEFERPAPR